MIKLSLLISFTSLNLFADSALGPETDDFFKEISDVLNQPSSISSDSAPSKPVPSQKSPIDYSYPGLNRDNNVSSGKPFPKNSIAHLNLSGEFLYMSAAVNDLYFAAFAQDGINLQDEYLYFDRTYKPAFRIALDYSFSAQGFSFGADWMQVHFRQNQTLNYPYGETGVPILVYSNIRNSYLPALNQEGGYLKGYQNLHLNQVDINLNKEFFVSKYFSLIPQIAGSFIWFNHHYKTTYGNSVLNQFNTVEFKNDFHGFGFKLGGNARFQLSQGLYLLSTGNVGISYGPRHQTRLTSQTALSFDQINGPYKNLTTQFKNRSDLFIPFFETRLDIGYRRTFDNNQYALDLFVGYEYHLFNDAVLTSNSSGLYDITESLNLTNHNLGLQGMNLGATFSF